MVACTPEAVLFINLSKYKITLLNSAAADNTVMNNHTVFNTFSIVNCDFTIRSTEFPLVTNLAPSLGVKRCFVQHNLYLFPLDGSFFFAVIYYYSRDLGAGRKAPISYELGVCTAVSGTNTETVCWYSFHPGSPGSFTLFFHGGPKSIKIHIHARSASIS